MLTEYSSRAVSTASINSSTNRHVDSHHCNICQPCKLIIIFIRHVLIFQSIVFISYQRIGLFYHKKNQFFEIETSRSSRGNAQLTQNLVKLCFKSLYNEKWLNASVKISTVCKEFNEKLERIEKDLATLAEMPDISFEAKLIYLTTLDINKAIADGKKLVEMQKRKAEAAAKVEKPNYWTTSLKTQINVGQTGLFNWAAGGDNTVSLAAFIDGNANWKKNDMFWNNRLQLDYGFVYASSKPILQKSDDRIYLESKLGYKNAEMRNFSFSANYDFKSQFNTGYDYKTPGSLVDENGNDLVGSALQDAWKDARVVKSGFLAQPYTNLAVGIDLKPAKWMSLNVAPLTGGVVIVRNEVLRGNYSMAVKDEWDENPDMPVDGSQLRSARFEFGAQIKADFAVNVNDNFKYTSQLVLFSNYLDKAQDIRVNWDNRFDWKLAKYFSLTFTTNMIYDDKVLIYSDVDGETKQRVQFKQSLLFGFTWTWAGK